MLDAAAVSGCTGTADLDIVATVDDVYPGRAAQRYIIAPLTIPKGARADSGVIAAPSV